MLEDKMKVYESQYIQKQAHLSMLDKLNKIIDQLKKEKSSLQEQFVAQTSELRQGFEI